MTLLKKQPASTNKAHENEQGSKPRPLRRG